jgi:hypothetical protein
MHKLIVLGALSLTAFAHERFLQGSPLPTTYADNATIPFKSVLRCGACIRGGYIFCIPGAEGSDPSTWGGKQPVCYQNSTTLAAANLASPWTCSNIYPDPTLAKGFCPFNATKCGGA